MYKDEDLKVKCNINIRLSKEKLYYTNQLKEFCTFFDDTKIKSIDFGKQDLRGNYCITVNYINNCCNGLKYFCEIKELLSFVEGFNLAYNKENIKFSSFEKYLKELI